MMVQGWVLFDPLRTSARSLFAIVLDCVRSLNTDMFVHSKFSEAKDVVPSYCVALRVSTKISSKWGQKEEKSRRKIIINICVVEHCECQISCNLLQKTILNLKNN